MKWIVLLILLAGCSDQATQEAPVETNDEPDPAAEVLIDEDWSYTNPVTVDIFAHDEIMGKWSVPEDTTMLWINITHLQEPFTTFASNGAYRGPNNEYDQDAFNGNVANFVVPNPAAGEWDALYRTARMEPNGEHRLHLTVTIL